ncbi:unnamed protein product [Eruca vesicaria subsp. sativa]|uniref:Uncharacterized protein n=1 Tax=Eruca vesicaria subsp. sativa TaxID=29727 RepID=A0ABC8J9Y3_ERUVS|nr:unnamed protein product [Eruca vesicaria subsp. sativa]
MNIVRGVFHLPTQTPHMTFQLPQWMLEPNGETWPPHKILTNTDLDMMMTVHEVATFHFRCRAPFTIGTLTFLGEGVTEEEHMALVLDIIRGNEILSSDRMLYHIFDENEMVLLYRFSLEMEMAKNSIDLNLGPMLEIDDHIVPNIGIDNVDTHVQNVPDVGNHEVDNHITGPNVPFNASPHLGYQAFNPGSDMPQHVHHATYQPPFYTPPWHIINVRPWYWENLMSSSYAMELQRIYGVRGSEYVGYVTNDLNIGNTNTHHMHGYPIPEPRPSYVISFEVSSTASSTELKNVVERVDDITTPKIKGFRGEVYQEKGESSSGAVVKTQLHLVVKLEMGNVEDKKDNDGTKDASGDA